MNTAEQTAQLRLAIDKHDYTLAAELAGAMAAAVAGGAPIADADRRLALDLLRKKRVFGPLIELATALIDAGKEDARVRRQLAQALIERAEFDAAEGLLRAIAKDPNAEVGERIEAIGLLGRVDKQRYVDAAYAPGQRERVLAGALAAYWGGYFEAPEKNYWHGINAISLTQHAERHGVALPTLTEAEQLSRNAESVAEAILRQIEANPKPGAWELATAAEAAIALGRFAEAYAWIEKYTAHEEADVFELSSTTRQFVQVLELDKRPEPEGAPLLERLRSANLKRSGGGFIPQLLEAARSELERDGGSGGDTGAGSREPVRVPILLRVSDPSWKGHHIPDLIITSRLGSVIGALGSQRSIDAVLQDPQLVGLEASREGGPLETDVTLRHVGVDRVPAALGSSSGVSASNVLIALIDGGVDILHEAFLDEAGKSRIVAYWDQADPTGPEALPNCGGTLHDAAAIASWVAKRQRPPGILRDDLSHGTHVASIAAGRACGNFAGGVAPDAKIIVVRGKTTVDPRDPQAVGYSLAHANALRFIDQVAKDQNMPVVVNVSQGQNAGAHDGTSLLEWAFDDFAEGGRAQGRVVVKSAGNERNKDAHAKVSLQPRSRERLNIQVQAGRVTPVILEIWFRSSSVLTFELVDPASASSPALSLENLEVSGEFASGNKYKLSFDYRYRDNGDSRVRMLLDAGSGGNVAAGRWQIVITSGTPVRGDIHAWIERGREESAAFADHVDEEMTLSIPGTAATVIAVGAVAIDEAGVREVAKFSSYGKTRDGREKPDISAPGVAVKAAQAFTRSDVESLEGTSQAAPHVTGAVALALALRPKLNAAQIQQMLQDTADPGDGFDRGSGYGLLDVAKFLAEALRLPA